MPTSFKTSQEQENFSGYRIIDCQAKSTGCANPRSTAEIAVCPASLFGSDSAVLRFCFSRFSEILVTKLHGKK